AGRGDLRGAAGLRVEPDRELDVVHRRVLHAHRDLLPARDPGDPEEERREMSLLQVQDVAKHFGKLVAVNGVTLNVEPGELRAVIGPNGAGKTTFFNLISGFFPPTSGRIVFQGQDITDIPEHKRVKLGMARTFQVTEIFPELTVRENIRVAVEVADGHRLAPWL